MIEQRLAELADLIAAINTDPELEQVVTDALASIEDGSSEVRSKHAAGLAELLAELRSLRKSLADIEASVESYVSRVMPSKTLTLPDGRVVERRSGAKRTAWEVRRLLAALVTPLTVTPNGEVDSAATEFASLMLDRIEAAHRFDHFRATYLREQGLTPDDYCTSEPGRRSIQISG